MGSYHVPSRVQFPKNPHLTRISRANVSRRKKKLDRKKNLSPTKIPPATRNAALDTLRGLAILLMIVDHVAWLYFDQPIQPTSIRFVTRLSMPLFCVLTGYFALRSSDTNWARLGQVLLAAIVVNFAYFTLYGRLEILASLLVCYLLIAACKAWFMLAALAFLLFPWDVSAAVFDYPISAVATCMAVGGIQRKWGWQIGLSMAVLISLSLLALRGWQGDFRIVSQPTVYVLIFLPLASGLLAVGTLRPAWSLRGLAWIGRYPLSVYVGQYFVLLAANRI